jgi:hypothetical protein
MQHFQELGEKIEKIWRDKNYDEELFPAIAAQALKEACLPEKVSAWQVMEWTMRQDFLPEQRDLRGKFGDPPITLYNAPLFHIDVYFWLEGTTTIHQHSFCGAFQVLHGSSLHSWYDFECHEKINFFTEVGNIKLKVCELLKVGDVKEILPGRQYIHGLFHLDQPSATIVVRTYRTPLHQPQFDYRKPFLAVDPFFEEPTIIKKMQCISSLIRAKHPDTDRFIAEWLKTADFFTSYVILLNIQNYLQTNQIYKLFNLETSQNRFTKFFEVIKKRHGHLADILSEVFAHNSRVNEIVHQRRYVTDPEHRFFLALLMNVDEKEKLFDLIKHRFPENDPLDKILDWTLDLAQTRVLGTNLPNALGIPDFDELDLFALENLLQEKSMAEMKESLSKEYGNEGENLELINEKLTAKIEKLKQAAIFQPLLESEKAKNEKLSYAKTK